MTKTLNIFQQEWHELQKKGTFHDVQIGLITDMHNKNAKLGSKIETMKVELKEANVIADQAKSTWEKVSDLNGLIRFRNPKFWRAHFK